MCAPSGTPLVFERRVSPLTAAYLAVVHALALAPLLFLPLPPVAVGLWLAVVAVAAVREGRRHLLRRGPRFVTAVRWDRDGSWRLRTGDGVEWRGDARDALVTPWLCVIHWRVPVAGQGSLLVAADAVAPDAHRRLRRALLEALAGLRRERPQADRP
ncbi:MAG: protein YgfX [Candidatus Competibacterales bacterium]|nr:protein YgfX [Candidatus Competibacterales bacterium]